ncbi:MAG: O-antigen ligase family protein [Chloroflexota bacterium]
MTFIWLIAAALAGLFIATQPLGTVVIVLAFLAFVLLACVSPLAATVIMLVLAPMRTLIATEASAQLPLDIGQLALIGFLLAWLIHQSVRGGRLLRVFSSPVSILLVIFIIVTGFTVFSATSLTAWLNEWLKWLQMLVLVTFTLNYFQKRRWEWLLFGLTLAAVAHAWIGIYEFFGGSGALHLLVNGRFFRAFGTFGQPNPFGGFMGLIAPITLMATLGYSLRVWNNRHSKTIHLDFGLAIFYLLSSGFILVGIGMSWSRGAWIGLGAALAVTAFAIPRNTRWGLIFVGSAIILVVMLWAADLLPHSIVERLSTSTQEFFAFEDVRGIDITPENYAVAERLAHWQAALNMATAHPLLGVGFGNYEIVYPDYRLVNWPEPLGHAHNYYLNMLAEAGIIGLLVYGKVWIGIMALSWRGRKHPDILSRFVIIGLLGTWVYLAVHSFFDNLYVNNLFLYMGLMLGILAILYNQTRTHTRLGIS